MKLIEKYGPWAVITGASEGTGAAFAHRLADEGINLILVARREGPLENLASEIRAKGVDCVTASVDLSADDAPDQIIDAAGDRAVGLFIANAGADTNGSSFLRGEVANWNKLVALNITTSMALCHHFGEQMIAREGGGIILVGSGACYGGLKGIAVYSGVKGFILNFSEGLWAELRHKNVDVLNLNLGRTDTPAHRKILEEKGVPIPQGMALPEDVARIGLEQLPHGPIYNWGQSNDVSGYAPTSPDVRRARILEIEKISAAYAGGKKG